MSMPPGNIYWLHTFIALLLSHLKELYIVIDDAV